MTDKWLVAATSTLREDVLCVSELYIGLKKVYLERKL